MGYGVWNTITIIFHKVVKLLFDTSSVWVR